MVPSSLILTFLIAAFIPSAFGYFWNWPKRRVVNPYFLLMSSIAALMVFTLILSVFAAIPMWFSWVSLLAALFLLFVSIRLVRASLATARARDRAMAQRRARGH